MRNFGHVATGEFNRRTVPIGGPSELRPNPADTSLRDAVEKGGLYAWVPDRPPNEAMRLQAQWQVAGYNWNPTTSGIQGPIVPPGYRAGRDNLYGRPGIIP